MKKINKNIFASINKNKYFIFIVVFATLYTTLVFAAPYSASDAILNPTCAPGAVDCYVNPLSMGATINSATAGSLLFAGTSGILAQDNSNLYWDDTNNYLGVGTATPAVRLDVKGLTTTASLSSEMITATADQDFSSDTTNWTGTNWAIAGGVATHTAGINNYILSNSAITSAPVAGNLYQITYTVNTTVAGTTGVQMQFGGTAESAYIGKATGSITQVSIIAATNTTLLTFVVGDATWTGTLDNVSIKLLTQANAVEVLRNSDGTIGNEFRAGGTGLGNSFIGYNSGLSVTTGNGNVGNGYNALRSLTTGVYNTAIGYQALYSNTTGNLNTAIGKESLYNNTTGYWNTSIGYGAMYNNTTGYENTAIGGFLPMLNNTTGLRNTTVGNYGLVSNTTGNYNTSFGFSSEDQNTTGSNNTGFGTYAIRKNTTGSNNTALGYGAGLSSSNIAFANNIFIGYQAGDNITTGADNNIVIGYDIDLPTAGGDNQMTIGNLIYATGLTSTGTTVSTGKVGIGCADPGHILTIGGTGAGCATGTASYLNAAGDTTFTANSSREWKQNITTVNIDDILTRIANTPVRNYDWKPEYCTGQECLNKIGFIAQEFYPVLTHGDDTHVNGQDVSMAEWLGLQKLIVVTSATDAKLTDIENLKTETTFVGKLREWLASATNGIQNFFAKNIETENIETEKLCFKNGVCVTGEQVQQLLDNANVQSSTPPVVENPTPTEDPSPVIEEKATDVPPVDETINTPEPVILENIVDTSSEPVQIDSTPGLIVE